MLATQPKYDNVFDFETRTKVDNIKLLERNIKLKKDGTPKKTHSNAKIKGSTWTDPIRNKEDVKKILEYIDKRISETDREDYKWQWERNKMYFCVAVFSGFRVCDLVGARPGTKYKKKDEDGNIYYVYPQWTGLKWNEVYKKDGETFRDRIEIKELKTGNMRKVMLSGKSKQYISDYVEKYHPDTKSSEYIFLNRQNKKLSATTIDDFIKEVTSECGIEGNYSTHSLRKTCIYHKYMSLLEKEGEEMALAKCMKFTGHRSISAFLSYLGLKEKEDEEDFKATEEYWDDVF